MPECFYRASMVGAPDIDCEGLQWFVGAPGLHR